MSSPGKLPRRDILLLPLISLGTAILLFAVGQGLALRMWQVSDKDGCYSAGRHRPDCVTHMKIFEGPMVEYRFNNCGYRNLEPCGPKPADTLRVVVVGTSMAEGVNVAYEDAYATVASRKLTAILGRPVEFQNLGIMGMQRPLDETIPEALALQPDAILMVLTPVDIKPFESPHAGAVGNKTAAPEHKGKGGVREPLVATVRKVGSFARQSRAMAVVQHYLMENEQVMYDLYRKYRDPDDPLQEPWSDFRARQFAGFDALLAKIVGNLGKSNVPFFFVLVPNRMQAALASNGVRIQGTDPYHLQRALALSAAAHGIGYIDLLPDFQKVPHAEKLFYPVDGHANAAGHRVVAEGIVNRLTDGSIPAFSKDRKVSVVSQTSR